MGVSKQFQKASGTGSALFEIMSPQYAIKVIQNSDALSFPGRIVPDKEKVEVVKAVDTLRKELEGKSVSNRRNPPIVKEAFGAMALCALRGIGCKENVRTASQLALITAQQDSPIGQYVMGLLNVDVLNPPRYEEAKKFFEQAAGQGHAGAQYSLAALHAGALISQASTKKGFSYLKSAAAQGHPKALYNMGYVYGRGLSAKDIEINPDPLKAIEYFKESFKKGFEPALGYLLEYAETYSPFGENYRNTGKEFERWKP